MSRVVRILTNHGLGRRGIGFHPVGMALLPWELFGRLPEGFHRKTHGDVSFSTAVWRMACGVFQIRLPLPKLFHHPHVNTATPTHLYMLALCSLFRTLHDSNIDQGPLEIKPSLFLACAL